MRRVGQLRGGGECAGLEAHGSLKTGEPDTSIWPFPSKLHKVAVNVLGFLSEGLK